MAHWDSAHGQAKMAKITQKHPYFWRSPRKTSNWKRFFSMSTCWIRRGFEQLFSSSGWQFYVGARVR